MRIAILGTGTVATTLGQRLVQTGHEVSYGSRNPAEHAGSLGHAEAVESAQLVITAIPGVAVLPTLEAIGEDTLGERIVLDPSVAINPDMSLAYPNDSVARQVQARFPRSRVVKSLNTMNVAVMIDHWPASPTRRCSCPETTRRPRPPSPQLLHDLGWTDQQILDLGGIATAVGTEHAAPLFFAVFMALQTPVFNIAITR